MCWSQSQSKDEDAGLTEMDTTEAAPVARDCTYNNKMGSSWWGDTESFVKWAGERQEKDWNRQFLAADAKAKDGYDLIVNSQVDSQNVLARFSQSMKMTLVKGGYGG